MGNKGAVFLSQSETQQAEICAPKPGGEEEKSLVEYGGTLKVKLPPRDPMLSPSPLHTTTPSDQKYLLKPDFQQEKDPHWAQTQVPYFRKRDEGPFRGPDDPPYLESMGRTRQFPRPYEYSVRQIVVLQRCELNDAVNGTVQKEEIEELQSVKADDTLPANGAVIELKQNKVNDAAYSQPRWKRNNQIWSKHQQHNKVNGNPGTQPRRNAMHDPSQKFYR